MEIIRWTILLVLVLPVPFILGLIPVKHMNSLQKTPAMTYVCGWFVSFFIFELVAVPLILLEKSFTLLVVLYTVIIGILVPVSLWQGRDVWKAYLENGKAARELPAIVKIGWFIFFLLVLFQMAYAVFYEYYDGDDAYYIATAVITCEYDSMYLRDAYTGLPGMAVTAQRNCAGCCGAQCAGAGLADVSVLYLRTDCGPAAVE